MKDNWKESRDGNCSEGQKDNWRTKGFEVCCSILPVFVLLLRLTMVTPHRKCILNSELPRNQVSPIKSSSTQYLS